MLQDPEVSCLQHWEAFKDYLRGLLIAEINKVKKSSSALKEEVESRVQVLEQQYKTVHSDSTKEVWQAAQSAYEHLLASSAEKKRFFTKQAFF